MKQHCRREEGSGDLKTCPKFWASFFQPDRYVYDSNLIGICCVGHQALINQVSFSPDGRLIASAAFDKSVKIWNGDNGK